MRCCRYMKFEHAAESLRSKLFKVAEPLDFNDPFECRGYYKNFEDVLRKYVHDNYERLKFEAIRRTGSTTPESQNRFTEQFLFDVYFNTASRVVDSSWIEAINNTALMMCFVKERGLKPTSDVLFWSHYADAGKGMRITFDLQERVRGGVYYMKDVEYLDKIPEFDCRKMEAWLQGAEFNNYVERLSHIKGKAWSYENEIRMIIPRHIPQSAMRVPGEYLSSRVEDGKTKWFAQINYGAIRRIDFGPRVDRERASRLISELKELKEASHIGFYEAVLKPGEYVYAYKKAA